MPLSENPYESPRIPNAVAAPQAPPPGHHGWKFVLLGIAIAGGIVSLAPWLGVLFAIFSAPVFLRYFVFGWKRPQMTPWDYAGSRAAGAFGAIGFGLSILAAVSGAFFGTCNVAGWSVAFSTLATNIHYERVIAAAVAIGVMAGLAAAVTALVWLVRFYYPPRA